MTRPLTRLGLGTLLVLTVQAALLHPVQAERRSHGWQEGRYGSRYNYRTERFHPLPRTGHAMPYRPRLERRP